MTQMPFRVALRCMAGCPADYPIHEARYECPTCGSLLDVVHDMAALRAARSGVEWTDLFDRRLTPSVLARPSGVWSKQEWVCPTIRPENVVSMDEGYSSLVPAAEVAARVGVGEVWIKQCGHSHTGSFKDLGMTVLVSVVKQMVADGRPLRAVACASTGDTSAALAAYAAKAGVRAVVLLPRGKISMAQLVQPLANGALVLALDTDFDGCMKVVQQLAREGSVYLANSMNSLRLEGQKTVAFEIVQQLGWDVPDVVVIPGGNLGNVSALGAGFDMMRELGVITKRPRIVVAQAQAANPLYTASQHGWHLTPITASPTQASAIRIGDPVSFARAVRALKAYDGIVEQASEQELAEASALADRGGFFTCPHTGVALAALATLAARGAIGVRERVVVISTANGLKFADFKRGYHEDTLPEIRATHANRPIDLPAQLGAVLEAIDRSLG